MTWYVRPSSLSGTLRVPPSKSQSIRALLFGSLAYGKSIVKNLLHSPDVEAMLIACRQIGATIDCFEDRIEIVGVDGKIEGAKDVIHAGNSGLVYRFIGAIASLSSHPIVITGDDSIRYRRPIKPLLEALNQLGVQAISTRKEGGAPIIIRGPIHPGEVTILGEDSQPVSGLLIASAFASGPVEIFVTNPGEKPWVNVTLDWFNRLAIAYTAENFNYYHLEGNSSIKGFEYTVPGDFSSLAFPLAAALVTQSEICIENLDFSDPQGDKKLITFLQKLGADIEVEESKNRLKVKKSEALRGGSFDVNDCIDTVPILTVMGCFAEGTTEIKGAGIARRKECDRISSIVQELRKMGAYIEEQLDGLVVHHSSLEGAKVYSHSDHRMALALAIAGLGAQGETVVQETACVAKTYPNFCEQMQHLGADINP